MTGVFYHTDWQLMKGHLIFTFYLIKLASICPHHVSETRYKAKSVFTNSQLTISFIVPYIKPYLSCKIHQKIYILYLTVLYVDMSSVYTKFLGWVWQDESANAFALLHVWLPPAHTSSLHRKPRLGAATWLPRYKLLGWLSQVLL